MANVHVFILVFIITARISVLIFFVHSCFIILPVSCQKQMPLFDVRHLAWVIDNEMILQLHQSMLQLNFFIVMYSSLSYGMKVYFFYFFIWVLMLQHRRPVPIALCVCLSVICCVVCCGQTVQDRPTVCIEVEQQCGVDILIGTIFDTLGPP